MNGRVIVDGWDGGGGFALKPRVVVTAGHVVRERDPTALRYRPSAEAEEIPVISVNVIDELDIAMLGLQADAPVVHGASTAVENERFSIDAGPRPNDPRLTGVIQAVRWPVTLRSQSRVELLQLGVDQPLADYSGYSGCSVLSPGGTAVGVLVEQLFDRARAPGARRAAPVLYAIPIEIVLQAFELNVRLEPARPPDRAVEVRTVWAALSPPEVERHFVARHDELAALASSWRSGEQVLVLHGLPGAGKSALAAAAARLAGEDFADGVLYLDMRGLEDAVGADVALDQVLDALGVSDEHRPQAVNQKSRLVHSALSGRSMLLVLDDVRDEQHVRPLVLRRVGCCTLITSRSPMPALEDVSRFEIGPFDASEGVHLLASLAGPDRIDAEQQHARRLVELCGGLPLAIRITGGRLATRPSWSLEQYATLLADERVRLERLRLGDLNVRASFEVSYRLLDDHQRHALRHLGLLHTPAIAAAALTAALGSQADHALEALADAGLVTVERERYGVHELIRLFARGLLTEDERYAGLSRLGEFYVSEVKRRVATMRTETAPDALRWATLERAALEQLPAELAEAGRRDVVVDLVLAMGPLYVPLHAWSAWERALRSGLSAVPEEDETGAALRMELNVAIARGKLGKVGESQRLLEEVRQKAQVAEDAGVEARALAQLGQIAKADGRPEDAVAMLKASSAAYRQAKEPHGEAQALGDLANALDDLGRHGEALKLHQDNARRFEKLSDRYSQGMELGNAGIALQRLDRLAEAEAAVRASLAAFESVGAEIEAAVATRRLAEVLWGLDDPIEGERLFADAMGTLAAAEATQELAELLSAREVWLVQAGRLVEALADARRAAELYAASGDRRAEALEQDRIDALREKLAAGEADHAQAVGIRGWLARRLAVRRPRNTGSDRTRD